MTPRLSIAIVAGALACAASAASAQDAKPTDPAAAEALFQKAKALKEKGDVKQACPIFEESYRLDPAPGTLLNLAACSRLAGKTATAWSQFVEAGRAFHRKGDVRRAQFAEAQAAEVEPLLAYVVVRAEAKVPGLVVKRDGTEMTPASFGTKLPMDPGEHVVVAEAEGYQRVELTFDAEPRQTREWVIPELAPAAKTPKDAVSEPARTPGNRGEAQRIAGFVIGGVGAGGLVAGAVFVGLTAARSSELEELCPNERCTTAEARDALAEAERFANAANGLLIGGAALAATGLVLILTAPSDDTDVGVTLVPTPFGAEIRGVF